jgi:prolyl-tRNA synthetase
MESEEKVELANKIYEDLAKKGIDTILDDRENITIGAKIKDCKILGTPYLVVIGDKQEGNIVELENNITGTKEMVSIDELEKILK